FHKGAFYLAEQFHLEVLPVLIHGNSEVNPKGSFIIKDGSITVKFLNRMAPNDPAFGENYTQRTKQMGAYFRNEFNNLRQEIESSDYFHELILENYRYKGDGLYKSVKKDLKIHKETYKKIIDLIGKNDKVVHLSKDAGQLDLLMALDSNNRKIITYLKEEEESRILQHCFITHRYQNIQILKSMDDALHQHVNVIIINLEVGSEHLETIFNQSYTHLIFLNESRQLLSNIHTSHFE